MITFNSLKRKRHSPSKYINEVLEPIAENANFKFARLSDFGLAPDPGFFLTLHNDLMMLYS